MQQTKGICEVCSREGVVYIHATMPFCNSCLAKELESEAQIKATAGDRIAKLEETNLAKQAEALHAELDTHLEIKTDVFNSTLPSIISIKAEIDADPNIENKTFELAKRVRARFDELKQIIFDLSEARTNAASQQRALVSYLNDLANKLRVDERESLKLKDINYKPTAPKPTTPKAPKVDKPKLDKAAIRNAAKLFNVNEAQLTILCYAKNMSIDEAIRKLKEAGLGG